MTNDEDVGADEVVEEAAYDEDAAEGSAAKAGGPSNASASTFGSTLR